MNRLHASVLAVLLAATAATPAGAQNAAPAEGGSNQVKAQAGCMNQWMFNGVWRVRVTNVAFLPAGDLANGWGVTMQWNNGTSIAGLTPSDTRKQALVLALANGDTVSATDTTNGSLNEQQLDYHSFPASGQFTYTQKFMTNQKLDESNKPAKLLITFDAADYLKTHPGSQAKFWNVKTPAYNYRIDLTCSK
jgi:hypothetical protein